MHTVDYFAVGAAILCTARMMAPYGALLAHAARIYAALIIGIGLGMFTRHDFDCKVYLAIGGVMILVDLTLFSCLCLCPSCACRLRRAGAFIRAALSPRPVPSKAERMNAFYGRTTADPETMKPVRPPPPPPPKKREFS
jgi:hypothetical protein